MASSPRTSSTSAAKLTADEVANVFGHLVKVGASPKQLGAVAASLGRVVISQDGDNDLAVRVRARHLRDAALVHESLRAAGFDHHGLGRAIHAARGEGVLQGEALRAARRVQRRGNIARHPPPVCEVEASSVAGLDVGGMISGANPSLRSCRRTASLPRQQW